MVLGLALRFSRVFFIGLSPLRPPAAIQEVSFTDVLAATSLPSSKSRNLGLPVNNNDAAQARYAPGVVRPVNIIATKSLGGAFFTR